MGNHERIFNKILEEICDENDINFYSYADGWTFELQKDHRRMFIIGYDFGMNSSAVSAICGDKVAASELMTRFGIPNVEHELFTSPMISGGHHNWERLLALLKTNRRLVCKPNVGSCGNQVYVVQNRHELENAYFDIFKNNDMMAVSPYHTIEEEYRFIILNGEIKLVYSKYRCYIVGDGRQTVGQLMHQYIQLNNVDPKVIDIPESETKRIPATGELVLLNWRHNLSKGSSAFVRDLSEIDEAAVDMVYSLASEIGLMFASIDVIKCADGYKVMEINGDVMMEHFVAQDKKHYTIAKDIYRDAVLSMLS